MTREAQKLINRIDDLWRLQNAYEIGFSNGAISGMKFAQWCRSPVIAPAPKESRRSNYSRLMKHLERKLKRMK